MISDLRLSSVRSAIILFSPITGALVRCTSFAAEEHGIPTARPATAQHTERENALQQRTTRRHSPRAAYTDVRSREATSMPRPTIVVLSCSVGLYHRHLILSGRSNLVQDSSSRQALLETDRLSICIRDRKTVDRYKEKEILARAL